MSKGVEEKTIERLLSQVFSLNEDNRKLVDEHILVVEEKDIEILLLKKRAEACERSLEDAKEVFLLLEKASGTLEELRKRKMECQWVDQGRFCLTPATHALPRPAIFVCTDHRDLWNREVEKANAQAGQPVHWRVEDEQAKAPIQKRAKTVDQKKNNQKKVK